MSQLLWRKKCEETIIEKLFTLFTACIQHFLLFLQQGCHVVAVQCWDFFERICGFFQFNRQTLLGMKRPAATALRISTRHKWVLALLVGAEKEEFIAIETCLGLMHHISAFNILELSWTIWLIEDVFWRFWSSGRHKLKFYFRRGGLGWDMLLFFRHMNKMIK